MTIKTLEYIHNLLIEEERKTKKDYQGARKLQIEYEERGADETLVNKQTAAADGYMKKHFAAMDALNDFEGQEW